MTAETPGRQSPNLNPLASESSVPHHDHFICVRDGNIVDSFLLSSGHDSADDESNREVNTLQSISSGHGNAILPRTHSKLLQAFSA